MNLQYTSKAIGDLQRLHDFIAPKNPLAAKKVAIEIQEAAHRLKTFPKIGLPVGASPDPESIRDLYIGSYTIRYQIAAPLIIVLRVWHNKEIEKDLL